MPHVAVRRLILPASVSKVCIDLKYRTFYANRWRQHSSSGSRFGVHVVRVCIERPWVRLHEIPQVQFRKEKIVATGGHPAR